MSDPLWTPPPSMQQIRQSPETIAVVVDGMNRDLSQIVASCPGMQDGILKMVMGFWQHAQRHGRPIQDFEIEDPRWTGDGQFRMNVVRRS